MFQTGLENTTDSMNQKPTEYLIAETDFIEMRIFTNDGFKLVDITQNTSTGSGQPESIQYLVEPGGEVKFPLIGKVNLKGKTIRELEIRNKTGANIVGFKTSDGEYIINPEPDTVMKPDAKLFVLGTQDQVTKLLEVLSS